MAKLPPLQQRRRRFYKLMTGHLSALDAHLHHDTGLFPTYVIGLVRWAALTAIQKLGPAHAIDIISRSVNDAMFEFNTRLEEVANES